MLKQKPMPDTEYVNCNLCGEDNTSFLYEVPDIHFNRDHFFKVVQCRECGLAYTNPRPTQKAMDYYYPKEFFDFFNIDPKKQNKRYQNEANMVEKYAPLISGRKKRLLDIGCANGDFPRIMQKKGWDVEGVEISSAANEISDFKVYNDLLPNIEKNEPYYDVITAWAVLEHLHDPMSYFKKVEKILNPGGVFIFLVTNVDSVSSSKLFREDLPRHTYFYNRVTVDRYLKKAGINLTKAIDHSDIYEMRPVGWISYYINKIQKKPDLLWNEIPPLRHQWFAEKNISGGMINTIRYVINHPIAAIDRLTLPLFEFWQKVTKTYGTTTYVAQKPLTKI